MDDHQIRLDFFGLRAQPFAPTADPVYFYATRAHKECLFRLWSTVDERSGIVVILGNYGTGKTTLLRKLLTGMRADPDRYNTAVVASPIPSWTSFALLESIVHHFGLAPSRRSFVAYMEDLNQYLLEHRERISTVIIDDAQNLNKRGQLELLRLVQNLETPQHKLLNLILFAQLEWVQVLRAAPNFAQRISMTYTLPPLSLGETGEFIEFRLRQARGDPDRAPVFDPGAIQVIHAYADGNPRVIVTLCRNALLVAGHIRNRRISHELMLHTIERTTVPDPDKRARVAMAVMDVINANPVTAGADGQEAAPPAGYRRPRAQEERASWLLLRAARAKQGSMSP